MELDKFREEILEEVHVNATMNGTPPREEFFVLYANALVDAEELDDYEQLAFEGSGAKGKRIQIDGYYYSELDNSLSIIICPFADSTELQSLTLTDAEIYFGRASAFVENALSGYIQKNAEESSPGYGLAIDIGQRYRDVVKYKFYLLSDMLMSARIKEITNTTIGSAEAEYHIWDISRLRALYISKNGKEDIVINLKEFTDSGVPCLEAGATDDYIAYLCTIPGSVLAKLYNKYGGRLLEGNVRSFLSAKGKINKEIRNTILNKPSMFFAYNNGIAATAYDVKIEYGKICPYITEVTSLQIVNGGQTTASLAAALVNDKDKVKGLRDIYVPMKLSVVTPEKAMELIPNIAKYANRQNKVSEADFFSNHPFHVRMEDFSRRVLAPAVMGAQFGTHWYYERARGQYRQEQTRMTTSEKKKFLALNPKPQMFTKTDLAKYYNIYRQLPHQVCTGAQKNFIRFAEWASTAWEKDQSAFNEMFFRKIVCLNILFKKTDDLVKHASWYEMGYKAQVVAYTLAYLFNAIEKKASDRVLDFKSIWNIQRVPSALELQISQIAEVMYNHLVSPTREVENVTEWAKRESCWKKAKELVIPISPGVMMSLLPREDDNEEQRIARKEQKRENEASGMIQVAEYGVAGWKKLLSWGMDNHVLTPQEISFIRVALSMESGKFPSDRQCVRILQVLNRARDEGYPE